MPQSFVARVPAKLWKLALVAGLAVAASTVPSPRSAEASPCTAACLSEYIDCRDACIDNCTTRVPCYSDCVDACYDSRLHCLSLC